MIHFEDVWEEAENLSKNKYSSISDSVLEINTNLHLLKYLAEKNIPEKEKNKIKSHLVGEILFCLSGISYSENIDVFKSLAEINNQKKLFP